MDLSEQRMDLDRRHPWEQSRAAAVERIVRTAGGSVGSILDYGCGDAYTSRSLLARLPAESLAGMDIFLTPEQCDRYHAQDERITLYRDPSALEGRRFDLVLLCDVLEHVEDDVGLLQKVRGFLGDAGRLLVTVPAFPALFSDQDRALKHYRRYTLTSLEACLRDGGLMVQRDGYLFGSLLLVRAAGKLLELARGSRGVARGVGSWRGGPLLTRVLATALQVDNTILMKLAEHRVRLPGLSAWALCSKNR